MSTEGDMAYVEKAKEQRVSWGQLFPAGPDWQWFRRGRKQHFSWMNLLFVVGGEKGSGANSVVLGGRAEKRAGDEWHGRNGRFTTGSSR